MRLTIIAIMAVAIGSFAGVHLAVQSYATLYTAIPKAVAQQVMPLGEELDLQQAIQSGGLKTCELDFADGSAIVPNYQVQKAIDVGGKNE